MDRFKELIVNAILAATLYLMVLTVMGTKAHAEPQWQFPTTSTSFIYYPSYRHNTKLFNSAVWSPKKGRFTRGIHLALHQEPHPFYANICLGYSDGVRFGAAGGAYWKALATDQGYRYIPGCSGHWFDSGTSFAETSDAGLTLHLTSGPGSELHGARYRAGGKLGGGAYISLDFRDDHVQAFTGPTRVLRVQSVQSMTQATMPYAEAPYRVIAKMAWMMQNKHHIRGVTRWGRVEYSPNTFSKGYSTGNDIAIQFDANQGGHAFVGGDIFGMNHKPRHTREDGIRHQLLTTKGTGTAYTLSDRVRYEVRLTWPQFTATLKSIGEKAGIDYRNYGEMETLFGPDWDKPDSWIVGSARYGLEQRNPNWEGDASVIAEGTLHFFKTTAI
jgi:hypothetical protein